MGNSDSFDKNSDVNYWFVGASFHEEDQTDARIEKCVWEIGFRGEKHIEKFNQVKEIKLGGYIAIKSVLSQINYLNET